MKLLSVSINVPTLLKLTSPYYPNIFFKAPTYLRSAKPFSLQMLYSMTKASTGDVENWTSKACKVDSVKDRKGAKYQSRKLGTPLNLLKSYIIWVFDNHKIQATVPHFAATNRETKDVTSKSRHEGKQGSEEMLKEVLFRIKK